MLVRGALKPTVSVAMGTHNGALYLEAQIASIVSQSCMPDELVIADDASTDGTPELLDDLAESCPFKVSIIRGTSRVGIAKNFERAIAACRGDFIVLADQDDVWHPDKVGCAMELLERSPEVAYSFSDAALIDAAGQSLPGTLWSHIGLEPKRLHAYQCGEQLAQLLRGRNFIYGMSMTFRASCRQWILPIASTSTSCGHDTWITLVLGGLGMTGRAIEEPLVSYRQHRGQAASSGPDASTPLRAAQASLQASREIDPRFPQDMRKIAERLLACAGQRSDVAQAARLFLQRATHLENRNEICQAALPRRAWLIAREARSGRYGRFSQSFKTALRDLIG